MLVVTGDDLMAACETGGIIALLRRRMLDQVKRQVIAASIGVAAKTRIKAPPGGRPRT